MSGQILWGIMPYIVLTIFIGGHIYRYQHDQFGWTAKSSELLEKKKLAAGSTLFHWGLLCVVGGHVMGILIRKACILHLAFQSIRITKWRSALACRRGSRLVPD